MLFISVLISWLIVRFSDFAAELHRDEWFDYWHRAVCDSGLSNTGAVALLIAILLVPVLALGIVMHVFGGWLVGLLGVAINIAVMLYACGRGSLDQSIIRYKNALSQTDASRVEDLAADLFAVDCDSIAGVHETVKRQIAYRNFERWFAPAFWFLLLGAAGALFYRLCHLVAEKSPNSEAEAAVQELCHAIIGWFDFLPARLWVLAQAVVADFSTVFEVLCQHLLQLTPTADLLEAVQSVILQRSSDLQGNNVMNAGVIDPFREISELEVICSRSMVAALVFVAVVSIVL